MRRAVGDAAGLTIKAQVRQAARNLGYPAEDWRVREAWYGRAGAWSAAAMDDLRTRFAAWREAIAEHPLSLMRQVAAIRQCLVELDRRVFELEVEIVTNGRGDQS